MKLNVYFLHILNQIRDDAWSSNIFYTIGTINIQMIWTVLLSEQSKYRGKTDARAAWRRMTELLAKLVTLRTLIPSSGLAWKQL